MSETITCPLGLVVAGGSGYLAPVTYPEALERSLAFAA